MASIIKVETLQDTNGNNAVDMQYVANGSAKQWSNNTISSNTHTIQDSFNTSSLTDDGAGRTDIVFTNNMANVRYSITSTCSYNGGHLFSHLGNNTLQATNHYRINTADYSGTILDYDCMCTQVCGDLA